MATINAILWWYGLASLSATSWLILWAARNWRAVERDLGD